MKTDDYIFRDGSYLDALYTDKLRRLGLTEFPPRRRWWHWLLPRFARLWLARLGYQRELRRLCRRVDRQMRAAGVRPLVRRDP